MRRLGYLGLTLLSLVALLAIPLAAQDKSPSPAKGKPGKPVIANRLTIEVTGGEDKKPIENASVYVKFVEPHALRKDKKYQLNVKTNRDGVTHVPDAPFGKVLIQVIAEGWKTFGRWYEITESQQTVQIHLEKPPRWY